MKTIIFATTNAGKVREVEEIIAHSDLRIISLKEAGIVADVEENGTTFEENAQIKARAIRELIAEKPEYRDAVVLADDSGLVIDYLGGEPGIYSARYLGEDTPYDYKNKVILQRLEGVSDEQRSARFVCAMAAALPDGELLSVTGVMEGRIAHEIKGENGFGYDPIFYMPEFGMTSAQLDPEQKNAVSHRGKALRLMKERLDENISCQ
ncbi:MAG: XTP/dITP diphosphatase [Lachnospiraceae bacterium]|nr:XTP/dITP diphosphatase [Lachnospiraceae bacterium]